MDVARSPSRMMGMMNLGSCVCRCSAAVNSFCKLFCFIDFSSARCRNRGVHIFVDVKET